MIMKRRTFCGSVLASGAFALTWQRALAVAAAAPVPAEVNAVTGGGGRVALRGVEVEELRARLRGSLLLPGSDGYDDARRLWNAAFDRRPALIARCAGAADVMRCVDFAREHDLLTSVRGGGHSISGLSACDGGLMIDLSPLRSVSVAPAAKTARVEGGVLLGHLDREAQAFGLATTAGTVSHTGVGGLTLGGGIGRIGRRFGLACDNVRAVDIVTADGKLRHASAEENPELFWGVRGAGGNFGVVTAFHFNLHRVDPVMTGGMIVYPFDRARELMRFYAEYSVSAPDELYIDGGLTTLPDGTRAVWFEPCYSGPPGDADRVLAPLRQFGRPLRDEIGPVEYVRIQASGDVANDFGASHYMKSGFINGLPVNLVDILVDGFAERPPGSVNIFFQHMGGAIARLPTDFNAFPHREATHDLLVGSAWSDAARAETAMASVRALWPRVEPFTRGFYVNSAGPDDEARMRANFGPRYDRLVALKNRYDPRNLFRLNANIRPTA